MIITGASVKARARKRSTWRVDSSAQWMSSMITTRGPFSLARSKSMVTVSKSCSRMVSSGSDGARPLDDSGLKSGSSAPRACRPAPAHSKICSRPCWLIRSRRAPTIGAYGRPSLPMGTHCPRISCALRSASEPNRSATNASTTVVLPAPASPPMITNRLPSSMTSSSVRPSWARCSARPTMGSVRAVVADLAARTISTIVPPGSDA